MTTKERWYVEIRKRARSGDHHTLLETRGPYQGEVSARTAILNMVLTPDQFASLVHRAPVRKEAMMGRDGRPVSRRKAP